MYKYTFDTETGGLILTDQASGFSKEARPVYAAELDILGFNKIWKYTSENDAPYLWAEANYYWYRGKRVAKTEGGNLYQKPEIVLEKDETGKETLPPGRSLEPVNIEKMIDKNRAILEILETSTIKKVYDVYNRYKGRLDCFHVAFSGGKDSIVLLDLVKRALPSNDFLVLFGDTGMEFPDTYKVVDQVEMQCKSEGIAFYRAASHFKPEESWKLFGPPSRVLRWCCSVHKSVPQTLKIREILGKNDYTGMDFVGVRASESFTRSKYEYENFGKKQKGQYSFNPILEWTSAEVWLYIYAHNLTINEAYKKGNSRAGCLLCPLGSGGKADYFHYVNYTQEIEKFISIIRDTIQDKKINSYISNGGWIERRNGRDFKLCSKNYHEEITDKNIIITVLNPKTDWRIWIETLKNIPFEYSVNAILNGYEVIIPKSAFQTPAIKLLKSVFHKSSSCIMCRTCETNCPNGAISFTDGLQIDNCVHCGQCHDIDEGCLAYHSTQQPKNGGFVMKSLNTFADHAPKPEWVTAFFNKGSQFLSENTLGPMQISMFKRFLSDAELIEKNNVTPFFDLIQRIGSDSLLAWEIILIVLVHKNPQFLWYIKNLTINSSFSIGEIVNMLTAVSISEKDSRSIAKAFKRFCDLPFGTKLHFGKAALKGKTLETLCRTKTVAPEPLAVLYGLYKFSEACNGYYEFTVSRLMDYSIESSGVSPTEIFGLERDELEQLLNGLSHMYPEFISFTTTHNLEVIRLMDNKTSSDVLALL